MKIQVAYWYSHNLGLPYQHQEIFDHSIEKRNEIINTCLEKGLSVMVRPMKKETGHVFDGELIWIDKGRFGQR